MKKISLLAVLFSFFITACGDSDGGANASTNAGTAALDEVYASEDDLPGCTEKYDGAIAFVKEGSTAFRCEDGRWENKGEYYANNDAIKNCTAKREGEVAYIVDEDKSLVCEDGKWVNSSNVSSSSSWSEVKGSSSSIASSSSWPPEGGIGYSSAQAPSSSSVAQSSSSVASSSSAKSSSSSVKSSSSITSSSSSGIVLPCKTESEDNCEYGILKDSRDGREYKTVKIGDQVWMAENLNFDTDNSWCYGDAPANCAKYGRLYTWAAAVGGAEDECGGGHECDLGTGDVQGVCPKGWHLPSKAEWETLIVAVDGSITEYTSSNTASSKLKSVTGWSDSGNGTDTFGFSALPAGYRLSDEYYYEGILACIWSSTEANSKRAYYMDLYYANGYAKLYDDYKFIGFSVRCLKD
ncbi:fibrobacter succinogenes major paralogous domain-containing protein [Fibrobacter sp.]|uniref:fibrobacter succinogenes major paralogous domain-containing protein n=1 Tax=Fibrobacter sp. TaxID=35828 RepID=UPI00262D64AF|nr:fibrobacter succinogenes major paralogous domain-containing protein [Fibrobacter sp.]